jgi:hypothetical protein
MAKSRNWFEHTIRRTVWRPERQVVALATLGLFISLILGALYLSQVAHEATINRRLSDLLTERDQLERINEQLSAEIASLESVPRLRARAQAMGFVDATNANIEYLPVDAYAPPQVDTVAPIDIQPEQPEDSVETAQYDESFTDWLGRQFDSLKSSLGDIFGG